MNLSLFATQTTGASAPLSGGSNPLFGGNGLGNLDFLNALLGNITEEGEIKVATTNENAKVDTSTEGLQKEAVDLTLLQFALLGQDVDKNLDEKLEELNVANIAQTQNNRVEQLTKLINHLTSGLPQEFSSEAKIEDLVSRLNKRLETLESSLDAFRNADFDGEDAPFKLLIATGLNPAQLTKITTRIEEVEAKLGRELTVEDLIAGVGNIIPAPGEKDHEFSKTDALGMLVQKTDEEIEQEKETKKEKIEDELSSDAAFLQTQTTGTPFLPHQNTKRATNLEVVQTPQQAPQKNVSATRNYSVQDLLNMIGKNNIAPVTTTPSTDIQPTVGDTTILPEDGITPVPQNLSNADFKALFGSNNNNNISVKNIAQMVTNNITPETSLPKVGVLGDLLIPANWLDTQTSQQVLSDILGYDVQTGTPFTTTMQAVHTSTTAQSAGQLHPGTSMVAAQITKSVQNGDTRNITLQLDPPELGRVEVRMEFGADNKVKAHLVVEKPETYLMLQRDAAALERALQDAGMDTGSDSLNYEMADDDYGFGQDRNNREDNSGTKNASHNYDDNELEIIETNINWNVDPRTGHVQYNIIA